MQGKTTHYSKPYHPVFVTNIVIIINSENIIMKSKLKIVLLVFIMFTGLAIKIYAQQTKVAGPSDTLVVIWSNGDPEVAEKACLMYAGAAKKYKWFDEVILIVWGPSEKLLAENQMLKDKVAAIQKDGVIVQACIACSNMYGVTDKLKVCKVDVKGMGVPLTKYLKRGYKVISY
jgi:hypothetical protein